MNQRIAIIGDGAWATVCAKMLSENGHLVRIWSPFPQAASLMQQQRENTKYLPGYKLGDTIEVTGDDSQATVKSELIISAIPTQFMRAVWERLKTHCDSGLKICSVTKGIENKTLLRPTQILEDVLGGNLAALAALSGPSIAPEIANMLPATVTVACKDVKFAEAVQAAISRPYFRAYTNGDLAGVELAGATKNVIAIAAGILDGLKAGDNAKAALLTRGLVEITRLGVVLGARQETFAGLAGMGDLVTTCISPMGRNRSLGEAIGHGKTIEQALAEAHGVVEGVPTTASVVELAKKTGVDMPITKAIYGVLFEGHKPSEAIQYLMKRPLRAES